MRLLKRIITFCIFVFVSSNVLSDPKITIDNIWINEAPPSVTVLAAYGLIKNNSDSDLILNNITTPLFNDIEIHKVVVENEISKMIKQDKLNIEAHSKSEFRPGGMHMMLYGPVKPMLKGDIVPFTFHFSDGSEIEIDAIVKKLSESSHLHKHHHH